MRWQIIVLAALVLIMASSVRMVDAPFNSQWWNTTWHYRFQISVNTSSYSRADWPIETPVNFTDILRQMGLSGTFDRNSTRLIEHNSTGQPMHELPSQFDNGTSFDPATNAYGTLVFILNGTTPAQTVRTFQVYFDLASSPKPFRNYSTNLTYVWTGEELNVSNSYVSWSMDTVRGQNVSGLYEIRETNTILSAGADRAPAEYVQYANGTYNFSFDLRNNASFASGPVRLVVTQSGHETFWNDSANRTNQGYLVKRYTFYNSSQWIRIEQNFTNIGNSTIVRNSSLAGALLFDLSTFTGSTSANTRRSMETDPGSYTWAGEQGGLFHVGVINANETGTTAFLATNESLSGVASTGRMGINLNATTLAPGASIYEVAIVHVDGTQANVNDIIGLSNRTVVPVVITTSGAEALHIRVTAASNVSVYNRGEAILLTGNLTNDSFQAASLLNATLSLGTQGTGDDVIAPLYDDGSNGDASSGDRLFTARFNLSANHTTGPWNVTVRAYDSDRYFLNESNHTFNVSSSYNANLTLASATWLLNAVGNGTLVLSNIRNDSFIVGANLSCAIGATPVTNITSLNNGSYVVNFSTPAIAGVYTLACNGTLYNNTGSSEQNFTAEEAKTNLSVSLSPAAANVTGITQAANATTAFLATTNNTGNATARNANLTLSLPAGWQANASSHACGTISLAGSCTASFNITVPNATLPGSYLVNITASWQNPDSTFASNLTAFNVTVNATPLLLAGEVGDNTTRILGNFTVLSIGNSPLENITFSTANLSNFTIVFLPANITQLNATLNRSIQVNVTAAASLPPGLYRGNVTISAANGGKSNVTLEITVPPSTNLSLSPS
ncbi:MAG: hypothetical protein HY520_04755, partial [Candidatus Aenigmarchaeota archaeon]|nr:hypothetical protein [Candidatus Aenigmarchaeota archaeon]